MLKSSHMANGSWGSWPALSNWKKENMSETTFNTPATADFQGVRNMRDVAEREGYTDTSGYAIQFAQALCRGDSLDVMRERLIALTSAAGHLDPDKAAADEIGQNYLILQALFRKLLIQSVASTESGGRGSSEAGERLLNGAFKAQRAAMACLSALKVLRDAAPTTPVASSPLPVSSGSGSPNLSESNELLLRHALD
jgi:hypothetical protein